MTCHCAKFGSAATQRCRAGDNFVLEYYYILIIKIFGFVYVRLGFRLSRRDRTPQRKGPGRRSLFRGARKLIIFYSKIGVTILICQAFCEIVGDRSTEKHTLLIFFILCLKQAPHLCVRTQFSCNETLDKTRVNTFICSPIIK